MSTALRSRQPVDDALIQIGRPQAPDPAREHDVVAVVNLRQVIEGTRLFRVGQAVTPAIVFDLEVSLLDVDVRRAVLAHRAQLDQVAVGSELMKCEQEVQRAQHVVHLSQDRVLAVHHRERRAPLLREVDHGIRSMPPNQVVDRLVIAEIGLGPLDVAP